MEEQLPAGLGEGQVAEFVEDDEVAADELVCGAAPIWRSGIGSVAKPASRMSDFTISAIRMPATL